MENYQDVSRLQSRQNVFTNFYLSSDENKKLLWPLDRMSEKNALLVSHGASSDIMEISAYFSVDKTLNIYKIRGLLNISVTSNWVTVNQCFYKSTYNYL